MLSKLKTISPTVNYIKPQKYGLHKMTVTAQVHAALNADNVRVHETNSSPPRGDADTSFNEFFRRIHKISM